MPHWPSQYVVISKYGAASNATTNRLMPIRASENTNDTAPAAASKAERFGTSLPSRASARQSIVLITKA